MESRRSRNICHCHRSPLHLSSTTLFLSWILSRSSFAQLTSSQPLPNTTPPTTLSTSTKTSSSSSLSAISTTLSTPPTPPSPSPSPATATTTTTTNTIGVHAFNYYFLIVAGISLLFCCLIFWFSRRKKRKALTMRRQSQRALARDVESWRNRFRGTGSVGEEGRIEGLDERGEVPPPYKEGGKPPSLRSGRVDGRGGEDVELRRVSADERREPPGYDEASRQAIRESEEDIRDVTWPRIAHVAEGRFGSMRRLLSDTRSAS